MICTRLGGLIHLYLSRFCLLNNFVWIGAKYHIDANDNENLDTNFIGIPKKNIACPIIHEVLVALLASSLLHSLSTQTMMLMEG